MNIFQEAVRLQLVNVRLPRQYGIFPQSLAHTALVPQGRVIIVLSMHTPTEYQCLGTVQAQKAIYMYMCDIMGH